MKRIIFFAAIAIVASIVGCKYDPVINETPQVSNTCSQDTVYFENDILPIFVSNCAKSGCHDASSKREGIQTTDYKTIRKEIRPFDPKESELYEVMSTTNQKKIMPPPPASPLTSAQLALIEKWINQGALNNKCEDNTNCDTQNVTYSGIIKPMMAKYCTGCHSGNAPLGNIDLSTYTNVAKYAKAGSLHGSIAYLNGYVPMPQGGSKLSQCQIDQVKSWIDAGALNN